MNFSSSELNTIADSIFLMKKSGPTQSFLFLGLDIARPREARYAGVNIIYS
jgi:hypothetical protein